MLLCQDVEELKPYDVAISPELMDQIGNVLRDLDMPPVKVILQLDMPPVKVILQLDMPPVKVILQLDMPLVKVILQLDMQPVKVINPSAGYAASQGR